ncbi:IWF1': Non-specific lipid-transfer protein [Bienertia sinuspersici]
MEAEAAINCGLVSKNLAPCVGLLENGQGPTAACCNAFPGIDPMNTAALPSKCGVSLPGSVVPQTDCSQKSSL